MRDRAHGRCARVDRVPNDRADLNDPANDSDPASTLVALSPAEAALARYPGARPPDRRRGIEAHGIQLCVSEWGNPGAPPILLAHGGFDFAQTFSVFAPLLADAGHRVVSWDQRGHGDSEHAALYSWEADMRDAVAVLDSISQKAIPLIGHSKGGSLLTQVALACPHRVSHLVNIDGLPSRRAQPDVSDHERTRQMAQELGAWLEHRHQSHGKRRRPGELEDLARRRARMNPRMSHEWLCFLASVGARKDNDGWRWKIDPALRFGGFGPWRPRWGLQRLPGLAPPLLGLLAAEREPMGFDSTPDDLAPFLPRKACIEVMEDTGHFIHIENPSGTANRVLEFLAS